MKEYVYIGGVRFKPQQYLIERSYSVIAEVCIQLWNSDRKLKSFIIFFSMCQAWMNEAFAPELLEHKTDIVNCILLQIKEMVCW